MAEDEQVPEGWQLRSLGDLCDYGPRHPRDTDDDLEVSFVPMAAVSDDSGRIEEAETRRFGEVKKGYTHFAEGDVIWAKITPCMENGKSAVARGLTNGIGCGSTEFMVLRSKGEVLPDFLHRYMRQESYRRLAKRTMKSGVGQARVPKEFVLASQVPVPPLHQQRRIVAELDVLRARSDAVSDALDAIPPLLERFRQSVLASAFRGDLTREWRAQNSDVEPASELLERIRTERRERFIEATAEKARAKAEAKAIASGKTWTHDDSASVLDRERKRAERGYTDPPDTMQEVEEAFGPVGDLGWVSSTLDGLCDATRGIPYGIVKTGDEVEGGVPTVRCGDIKNFQIDRSGLKTVDPELHEAYSRTRLSGGEVLLAIRGTVGNTAIAEVEGEEMNISREVAMIPPLTGVLPAFLMYLLASPLAQRQIMKHVKGVAQSGINLGDLRALPVPLPPLNEQEAIVHAIEDALERVRELARLTAPLTGQLERLRQSILSSAFRGELVPPGQ